MPDYLEITVEDDLYRKFEALCLELGTTPESFLEQMLAWTAADPEAARAYTRKAAEPCGTAEKCGDQT